MIPDRYPYPRKLAIGQNRTADGVALVGGVLFGIGILWMYPTLDQIYNLIPDHPVDWQLLALFVGLPALIAVRDGGLLASWWVDIPPLLAIYVPAFTVVVIGSGDTVIREFSFASVLPAIAISVIVALLWGTLGFGLGKTIQMGLQRYHSNSNS